VLAIASPIDDAAAAKQLLSDAGFPGGAGFPKQTLIVRGYIGFELLGQNQYWTRLPDSAYSALDPAVNPNPAANPNPAVNPKRPAPCHRARS
jgi:hypothetical protein